MARSTMSWRHTSRTRASRPVKRSVSYGDAGDPPRSNNLYLLEKTMAKKHKKQEREKVDTGKLVKLGRKEYEKRASTRQWTIRSSTFQSRTEGRAMSFIVSPLVGLAVSALC